MGNDTDKIRIFSQECWLPSISFAHSIPHHLKPLASKGFAEPSFSHVGKEDVIPLPSWCG